MNKINKKETKVILPKDLCEMEAVKYVAFRYATTPELVLEHYLIQCGIIPSNERYDPGYTLAANEIALFQDLGVQPSILVIK